MLNGSKMWITNGPIASEWGGEWGVGRWAGLGRAELGRAGLDDA